jgi:hypothetical protein
VLLAQPLSVGVQRYIDSEGEERKKAIEIFLMRDTKVIFLYFLVVNELDREYV